jgi:hypothetical protein
MRRDQITVAFPQPAFKINVFMSILPIFNLFYEMCRYLCPQGEGSFSALPYWKTPRVRIVVASLR